MGKNKPMALVVLDNFYTERKNEEKKIRCVKLAANSSRNMLQMFHSCTKYNLTSSIEWYAQIFHNQKYWCFVSLPKSETSNTIEKSSQKRATFSACEQYRSDDLAEKKKNDFSNTVKIAIPIHQRCGFI